MHILCTQYGNVLANNTAVLCVNILFVCLPVRDAASVVSVITTLLCCEEYRSSPSVASRTGLSLWLSGLIGLYGARTFMGQIRSSARVDE